MNTTSPVKSRDMVLYVDDEPVSLKLFKAAYGEEYEIVTASSAREGLERVAELGDRIGVLISDQWMPGESGIWLLRQVRELDPRVIRILATAYCDKGTMTEALWIDVYRVIQLPWDPYAMVRILQEAMAACWKNA